MKPIDLLRQKLWEKSFGEIHPKAEKWMGRTISEKIEEALGDKFEEKKIKNPPHPDTIVNFLNEKNTPKQRTLDLLSWYLIGDADNFKSYQDFVEERRANQEPVFESIENSKNESKKRSFIKSIVLLFLILFSGVSGVLYYNNANSNRETSDEFNSIIIKREGQKSTLNAWRILDENQVFLDSQLVDGALTLWTMEGGYWVKEFEEPIIKNFHFKDFSCANCKIEAKIHGFTPNQPYQQAGIFLLGEKQGKIDKGNWICIVVNYSENCLTDDGCQKIQVDTYDDGEILYSSYGDREPSNSKVDSTFLKIEVNNSSLVISYKFNYKHITPAYVANGKDKGSSIHPLNFEPRFIGIGAYYGHTDQDGNPRMSDTIPVFFDYIRIE